MHNINISTIHDEEVYGTFFVKKQNEKIRIKN